MTEAQHQSANPEYLSIGTMLKARPSEEKGERFIYLEASREGADQQNDIVLAKALEDSAPHFLKFGNIDIDHKSMPSIAAQYGITEPEAWEVGVPEEVRVEGPSVFVKARLFKGDTQLASKANMVWESMTQLSPPARWYASVGGATLARRDGVDHLTKSKVSYVTKVRWSNLAISRQPVNQHVSAASTIPFGILAKCWTPAGFDMAKALEASYATDVSQLSGGGALGMQSIDAGPSYFQFRDQLSESLLEGRDHIIQSAQGLADYAMHKFGLSRVEAVEWVTRFMRDIKNSLTKRGSE
jgi:hypothetical protein